MSLNCYVIWDSPGVRVRVGDVAVSDRVQSLNGGLRVSVKPIKKALRDQHPCMSL